MTVVYEMRSDPDYAWLHLVDDESTRKLDHAGNDGVRYTGTLPIRMRYGLTASGKNVSLPVDCPKLPAYGGVLLSDRSVEVLAPMLQGAGYFLDVELAAEIGYSIFICEREVDAINYPKSELKLFSSGRVWEVHRLELEGDVVANLDIFRLRNLRSDVYVSSSFVERALSADLTGFVFREVWSAKTGGTDLNVHSGPRTARPGVPERQAAEKRSALRSKLIARGLMKG